MAKEKNAYVTVISSDDYLPGALAMFASLKATSPSAPMIALATSDLQASTCKDLERLGVGVQVIEPLPSPIPNPSVWSHWDKTYAKLRIFGLTNYQKIIFIDADMIVLANLDHLFGKPHLSAVNAGGRLPDLVSWVDLNSGFMVIEPSAERMNDIISHLTVVPEGEHAINMGQHSDQSFLIGYCKGWSNNVSVHLDHRYNIFHIHLDRYVNDLGYEYRGHVGADMQLALEPRIVAIVHFIGQVKPWFRNFWIEYYGSWFIPHRHRYYRASVRLWRHFYKLAMQAL